MEHAVRQLFERYERLFNQALHGQADLEALAALYAPEMIGAAPAGVRTASNDGQFKAALAQGYAQYRAIGTQEMHVRSLRVSKIDALHGMAQVEWSATYLRKDGTNVTIDFAVHYLVQMQDGAPKVFGWISGDEQALLRQHGIV